jgi:hypothetical protein
VPKFVTCLLLVFVAAAVANAQTAQATLQGLVLDPAHAVVPDANVTVANVATGVVKNSVTNADGRFVVPYLLPGDYRVTVEKSGFQRYERRNVKLDVQQTLALEVTLSVGDVSSTIEVKSEAAPLDSATSAVTASIDSQAVTDLPLLDLNVLNIANIMPGVLPGQGSAGSTGNYGPTMGGGRSGAGDIRLDGSSTMLSDANNGILQSGGSLPNVDAVAEVTVITNTLAAEYGRTGGGAILVASKMGANVYHGSLYEFFKNNNLNANDFFSNRAGGSLVPFTSHQFGVSGGGPVRLPKLYNGKNRTFFFADYQGLRARRPSYFLGTVPLDAWKNGDFSQLKTAAGQAITIYDPLSSVSGDRQAFAGNVIPVSRMDPVAQKLLTYYPQSNTTPQNVNTQTNNFYRSQTARNTNENFTMRVDHNITPAWRSFWRMTEGRTVTDPPNVYGNPGTPLGRSYQTKTSSSATWNNVYTLSPTTFVEMTYGLTRFHQVGDPPSAGFDLTSLGFPSYLQRQAEKDIYTRFPLVAVNGLSNLGQQSAAGIRFSPTGHNVMGTVTHVLRQHTIKAGVEYKKFFLNFWQESNPGGSFSFNPNWTQRNGSIAVSTQGFGIASMLVGLGSGSQANNISAALTSSYWGGYVQDDYRVSRKLTLNIGLRYDIDLPKTERYNRLSYWDATAVSPIAGKAPGFPNLIGSMQFTTPEHRTQFAADTNNFSPRFGFAYQINRATVFRGGYAYMYSPGIAQATYGNGGFQGFNCSTSWVASVNDVNAPLSFLRNPFPNGFCAANGAEPGLYSGPGTALGQAINQSWFPTTVNPNIQQWNANLQRQLPGRIVVEVGWAGNKGNHLIDGGSTAYNQLRPEALSLGSQLTRQVTNPFYGVVLDPSSILALPTVAYRQLLALYPQYTSVNSVARPTGNSLYHSLLLRVQKRLSNGVGFMVSYTTGKLLTDSGWGNSLTSTGSATPRQNAYDRKSDRALDVDDVSSRLVVSFNAELPFGRRKHFLKSAPRAVDALVGGWQLNGIVTMQSGLPIALTQSVNQTNILSLAQRPNNNGRSAKLEGQSLDAQIARWFDPSVFSIAAPYTFGNAPTVLPDVRHPGIRNFDLSLFKSFRILSENKLKAQLRLEAANALNTTQLGRPATTVGLNTFGVISNVGQSPRSVQVALKLLF